MMYPHRHGVRVTHRPTGRSVFVSQSRSLGHCRSMALRWLACILRVGKRADPPKRTVRTYTLDGPAGLWQIRDKRTGRVIEGEQAVRDFLDARFDELPK